MLGELRRAARAGDPVAFRGAIGRLARTDRNRWRAILARADIGRPLAALDAALYGRSAERASAPALTPLARAVVAAWRDDATSRESGARYTVSESR